MRRVFSGLSRSHFIVSPLYDSALFLFSPLAALGLGVLLSLTHWGQEEWTFGGAKNAISSSLLGVFIHAHLFIVIFRSHLNGRIRAAHPWRFWLVPPVLLLAMLWSTWILVIVSVVCTFWDVYHSGLQTFGLSRIYDSRVGNDPKVARTLDVLLNHLLYAGPILGGATMLDHFEDFHEFDRLGTALFASVPAFMESHHQRFAWALLILGGAFLVFYVAYTLRLIRNGYRVSVPKVCLLVTTGACSIYTWGFNSFGEAFFIMNFFHALQYFALVWSVEQRNLARLFHTAGLKLWKPVTLLAFVSVGIAYGVLVESTPVDVPIVYPLSLVVSAMHFWYDGFVWSVRKQQV